MEFFVSSDHEDSLNAASCSKVETSTECYREPVSFRLLVQLYVCLNIISLKLNCDSLILNLSIPIDMGIPVQCGWWFVQFSCFSWWARDINYCIARILSTIAMWPDYSYACQHIWTHQKAGFLFVESSFISSGSEYVRRVVFAVSSYSVMIVSATNHMQCILCHDSVFSDNLLDNLMLTYISTHLTFLL